MALGALLGLPDIRTIPALAQQAAGEAVLQAMRRQQAAQAQYQEGRIAARRARLGDVFALPPEPVRPAWRTPDAIVGILGALAGEGGQSLLRGYLSGKGMLADQDTMRATRQFELDQSRRQAEYQLEDLEAQKDLAQIQADLGIEIKGIENRQAVARAMREAHLDAQKEAREQAEFGLRQSRLQLDERDSAARQEESRSRIWGNWAGVLFDNERLKLQREVHELNKRKQELTMQLQIATDQRAAVRLQADLVRINSQIANANARLQLAAQSGARAATRLLNRTATPPRAPSRNGRRTPPDVQLDRLKQAEAVERRTVDEMAYAASKIASPRRRQEFVDRYFEPARRKYRRARAEREEFERSMRQSP